MDKENRGRYGGWERGIKGSSVDRDGDSCSTVEVIKTHKANGGWMMGACVYLNTAAKWKMSVEVRL